LGPNYLSEITNLIQEGLSGGPIDMQAITNIACILIVIYGVSLIVSLIQGLLMATVTQRTAGHIRDDIIRKINRVPLGFYDNAKSGDLMSRVTNDADTLGQDSNRGITIMVTSVAQIIGSLVMMAITSFTMMGVVVASTLFGFILMAFMIKISQRYFNEQQDNLGLMNAHVAETYNNHSIMRSFNGIFGARAEFDRINDKLQHTGFMSQFLSGIMVPMMMFMGNFGYVMVCIAGAVLVLDGAITIGTIVAFMIYVRLFTQPLQQMSQGLAVMQSVAAAAGRLFAFLDMPEYEDESGKTQRIQCKGHVEFRDIHFGYTPDKEVIHGFSAEVMPGQKVAIVGPTGAGKTTIVNLLMRFYEVNSGDILLDGVSVKDLTRENVHEQFCMVLQDSWLFEGTIRENIVYCRKGISDEEVEEACKAAGIHWHIMTLPNGYDTKLSDTDSLSMGQMQQLTIARAMIDRSPMLILDEATSSVDTRTEAIIQEAMDKLAENRTSFVIAHRLSTIRNSDLILVMNEGSIVEQGTHDQLLAQGGFYRELYDSQFDEFSA